MSNDGTILKNLEIGMNVEINPQTDRTRKLLVAGKISEILTNASKHPHGILVVLESGDKGRVKIISDNKNNSLEKPHKELQEVPTKSIKELIEIGENSVIEFKSNSTWSMSLQNEEIDKSKSPEVKNYGKKASKVILAKTIAGFLNTEGGTLIIGVQEEKESDKDTIIGIEIDYKFLKDKNTDGYLRMIEDLVKTYLPSSIFHHFNKYLKVTFEEIDNKIVCGITALKSQESIFINVNNEDHFYIRGAASTYEISGKEMLEYCDRHFSK